MGALKESNVRTTPGANGNGAETLSSLVISVTSAASGKLERKKSGGSSRSVALTFEHERRVDVTQSALVEVELIRAASSKTWSNLERVGFVSREIADVVDTSVKTVQRKKKAAGALSLSQADRTVRLVKVYLEAVEAIGDAEKAMRWLRSPVRHLGGRTPLEMIATEAGTALVRESLGAIAYGGVG